MQKPSTTDEYISTFPENVQTRLTEVRKTIQNTIPDASEELKWSRPAFVDEQILVMFGGFKNHIGFYTTPTCFEAFQDQLENYKTGRGSVQFPHNQPLPLALIREMTKYRAWESRKKGVNWKS